MWAGFFFLLAYSPIFVTVVLVAAVGLACLSYLPKFLVQNKSKSRRKPILDRVLRDQEAFDNEKRPLPKSEDDDWEQVSSETSSKAAAKAPLRSDYNGFIGFFHPFA